MTCASYIHLNAPVVECGTEDVWDGVITGYRGPIQACSDEGLNSVGSRRKGKRYEM